MEWESGVRSDEMVAVRPARDRAAMYFLRFCSCRNWHETRSKFRLNELRWWTSWGKHDLTLYAAQTVMEEKKTLLRTGRDIFERVKPKSSSIVRLFDSPVLHTSSTRNWLNFHCNPEVPHCAKVVAISVLYWPQAPRSMIFNELETRPKSSSHPLKFCCIQVNPDEFKNRSGRVLSCNERRPSFFPVSLRPWIYSGIRNSASLPHRERWNVPFAMPPSHVSFLADGAPLLTSFWILCLPKRHDLGVSWLSTS